MNLVPKKSATPGAAWRQARTSIIASVEGDSGVPGVPNLHLDIQKLFDLEVIAQSNGSDLDLYAGAGAYDSFLEAVDALPQPYLEVVEPGIIVASEVASVDEFFDAISVERLVCYNCIAAIRGDVDARPTVDDDLFSPESEAFLTRWLAELLNPLLISSAPKDSPRRRRHAKARITPATLNTALWLGRWRSAHFWNREFDALMYDAQTVSIETEEDHLAKSKRERAKFGVHFPTLAELRIKQDRSAMEDALLLATERTETRSLGADAAEWKAIGKKAGLGRRACEVLALRSQGKISRSIENETAYREIHRAHKSLAEVIAARQAILSQESADTGFDCYQEVLKPEAGRKYLAFRFNGVE
jgi:hypothetical protein